MTIKGNIFKTMIIVLSSVTVLGVVALILVLNLSGKDTEASGERSIDEVREASLLTEDITTDLKNGDFVRIRFRIVTDSEDALEELEKRDFQMQNIVLKELAKMEAEAFKSGLTNLEETLKLRLNEFMTEGKITNVYTVNKVLQ